jgi:hypothetical protein
MGSQEMCLYFDLCRELIGAAWAWCENEGRKLSRDQPDLALGQLTQLLAKAKVDWLREPFEGGPPPDFLIQCDRRRVPVGAGVAIDGMDEVPPERHANDCDCPICEMIAEGMFGISFSCIDGHHLELDDEFAFSLHETREAWEEQQREYAEFAAGVERQRAERQEEDEDQEKDDAFASAWSGLNTDEPFPGDGGGHLKMAFMVAEIVSTLESLAASREEIKGLNACFASYRQCEDEQRAQRATEFKATLQSLADHYPSLIAKSSDLQSRIDEALRTNTWDDNDAGYPF